ncbi:protein IQ-DOMAIN 33 isoform X1 [Alnus glutinosa]|uniref:protein IQ-DOMAIN 33 isoform X1 n=1 Tax=Alnus glutinosa TaxID=3517 RepID=UPI002D767A94|nr:protein IQ-DOMAIN 33 isoform X1 [Alnus glutinosa]
MGITGELVRSVFSRNRSVGTQESNVRSNVAERKRWSSVRSYLCGDEFNSVLAEEDSASVKSSEATVTQPMLEDLTDKVDIQNEETKEDILEETQDSTLQLLSEENAAIIIQSAFRGFLARHDGIEGIKLKNGNEVLVVGTESPSRESVGTSVEVQTGNSAEVFSVQEERVALHHGMQQKARTQVLRLKEDWDDSTVSSNISRMRIQNRLEATTRRERALAYAFSQQLRICSKRKQSKANCAEPNMGWSWLERWMATRLPESSSVENQIKKQLEPIDSSQKFMFRERFFDAVGEEKESCGSNEVSVQFDSFSAAEPKNDDGLKPNKNRLKATRSVSRRKTVPSYPCTREYAKVNQKIGSKETEDDTKNRQNQPGSKRETKCKNSSS